MESCTCKECVACCQASPGWFAPGEAEKAAQLLGVPWPEFKKRLIVDYWAGSGFREPGEEEGDTNLFAPRKVGVEEDKTHASWSYAFRKAPCTFLKNNLCEIHDAKPYECKNTMGCGTPPYGIREQIKTMWQNAGEEVEKP